MKRFAAILCAAVFLAGCASDPLRDVPRLSDADVSDEDIQAAIRGDAVDADAPVRAQSGVLSRLFGGREETQATDAPENKPTDLTAGAETSDAVDASPEPVTVDAAAPQGGLLGFLRRAADDAQNADEGVDVAALPQESRPTGRTSSGLFSRGREPGPGDPDYSIVPLGTALPYGTLARVCNVRPRQLGKRVDSYPESRSVYELYDSNTANTAPHTFYVTGFKDGCARQFTAAVAVFGSTVTHEQLRYGLPAKLQPYSETDAAYERLKSRICRVGRGQPCGTALPRLSRNTVFVSVYERFGSNPVWKTILIHDGEVIETDIRSN